DPVTDNIVVTAAEPVDALDLECRRAYTADLRTHREQHLAQVNDLRLTSRVVDERRTFSKHGGHEDVLRRPNARKVQPDLRTGQLRRLGDEIAVRIVERGAEALQAHDVEIEPARTDGVTTRKRDPCTSGARQQRAEHADRAADPPDMLVVRLEANLCGHTDADLRRMPGHFGAKATQDLAHDGH